MSIIKCSEFVKRQTKDSEFSYFNGSWKELEELALYGFLKTNFIEGYREGVIIMTVPSNNFFSSLIKIDNNIKFETKFEARKKGEEPYIKTIGLGIKQPAIKTTLILYRKDVLKEDKLYVSQKADWEIVSINCSIYNENNPILPMTMARNQLADNKEHGKGGTKANYTTEEFAKSIIFWKTHCLIKENNTKETPIEKARNVMKKKFESDSDFADVYKAQIACFIMDNFSGYKKNKTKRDKLATQLFDTLYMK